MNPTPTPHTSALFRRLVPAAVGTSLFAALAHALLVAIAARSIGLELVFIAGISFIVALLVALPGGVVLLAVVALLRLGRELSLLLFFAAIQATAVALEMVFFEISLRDISWQYGLISVPASVVAWYLSIGSAGDKL